MVNINFDRYEEEQEFELLPKGTYLCQINNIETLQTKAGDEYWKFTYLIVEGEFADRYLWDKLFFHTEKTIKRFKIFLEKMGVEPTGEMELHSAMFVGRFVYITIKQKTDDYKGVTKLINEVDYTGWQLPTKKEYAQIPAAQGMPCPIGKAYVDDAEPSTTQKQAQAKTVPPKSISKPKPGLPF